MKKKLNPRERLVCKAYLENGYNKTQAMITAGFNPRSARTLATKVFAKDYIKEHLDEVMAAIERKLEVRIEDKLDLLWKVAQRAYGPTDEEVEKAKEGIKTECLFEFQPNAVVNAVSELNKMQGHHHVEKKQEPAVDSQQLNELIKENEKDY